MVEKLKDINLRKFEKINWNLICPLMIYLSDYY